MNPDSQNFDSLRRLLALKRHEQPPPGYFNRFSRDVMARIKAGETGGEGSFELPFLRRLFALFDMKPVFAGAFGMAMCALLISGVIAQDKQAAPADGPAVAEGNGLVVANPDVNSTPQRADAYFAEQSSTNPVAPSKLFERLENQLPAQIQVGWVRPGN